LNFWTNDRRILKFFEKRAQKRLRTFLGMVHGKRMREPISFISCS
jgi:hypothetical protein